MFYVHVLCLSPRSDLHKVDVITFALQRAEACLKDDTLPDAASAALLWKLLVLLCRQNGVSAALDSGIE